MVMVYINIYYLLCATLNVFLKKFLQKYGVIAIILHVIPIVALQFVITLQMNYLVIVILALLASFAQILYSVPLNLLFSFTDKEVNVAKFQIATNIGKLIFTLIGGCVIGLGYKNSILILSIVGSILYIASAVPIFYGYSLIKTSYNDAIKIEHNVDKKEYGWFNFFHVCFSIFQSVLDILVPIYLFLNNLTFETVAIVVAIIELCKILANLLAKKLVKNGKIAVSVAISVSVFLIGTIFMLAIKIPVILFVCSSFIAVSFPLLFVPMFGCYCKKLKVDNYQFDGMSNRDVYIFIGKCLMYVTYFVLPNIYTLFVVGAIGGVMMAISSFKILRTEKQKNI